MNEISWEKNPFSNEATLKVMNLLPTRRKFFYLSVLTFEKEGMGMQIF